MEEQHFDVAALDATKEKQSTLTANAKCFCITMKKQKADLLLIPNLKKEELNLSQCGMKVLMIFLFNFKVPRKTSLNFHMIEKKSFDIKVPLNLKYYLIESIIQPAPQRLHLL